MLGLKSPSKRNRVQSRRTQVSAPPPRAPRPSSFFFPLIIPPPGATVERAGAKPFPARRARDAPATVAESIRWDDPPFREPRADAPAHPKFVPFVPAARRSNHRAGPRREGSAVARRPQERTRRRQGGSPLLPAAEIPGRPLATRVPGGVLIHGQHPKRRRRPVLPAQPRVNTPGERPTRPRQPRRVLVQPARPGRRPIR